MQFKRADRADIQRLVDIRVEFLRDDVGGITDEQESMLRERLPVYYEKHIGQDFFAFIALDDGIPVSSVFLVIAERPTGLRFPNGKVGTVLNVYTNSDHRRRGYAERLMRLALDEAKSQELDVLELNATQIGEPLYEKLGFRHEVSKYTPMKIWFT